MHEHEPDIVATACVMFTGKVVAEIPAQGEVPGRWLDVLATWSPTRNHPGLGNYQPRQMRGWTRRGQPLYDKR
jgi:hypothetical protein